MKLISVLPKGGALWFREASVSEELQEPETSCLWRRQSLPVILPTVPVTKLPAYPAT